MGSPIRVREGFVYAKVTTRNRNAHMVSVDHGGGLNAMSRTLTNAYDVLDLCILGYVALYLAEYIHALCGHEDYEEWFIGMRQ